MLFNSYAFVFFLPTVFCLYWFVFGRNLKWQNLFVVAASYVFYGWWDWRFLALIALTSFCSWSSGLLIARYRDDGRRSKWISAANIILNLAILGLFKYYDFFAQSFANLFLGGRTDGLLLHLVLPVGISFYTFQALSYSIDVYRGKIEPVKDIVQFFAYVSFFPQLVAGPIERATNLLPQFGQKRTFDYAQATDGLRQMLWGFFKKIVVADECGRYVDQVFNTWQNQPGVVLLLGIIFFAFQIYGDFSGYSDIATGVSKLFGIRLMPNFKTPYFSRNIAEFWRRWHISLTTWFRDYVYIPLGGSRCSKAKTIRNTFVIFLLCGLWHGAEWTFVIWGAYNALLFLPLILTGSNRHHLDTVAQDSVLPSWKEFGQMTLTFVLFTLGLILFRSDSLGDAWHYFLGIFKPGAHPLEDGILPTRQLLVQFGGILVILIVLIVEWFDRNYEHALTLRTIRSRALRWAIYSVLILAVLLFYDDGAASFIYFQF
jgi:D-alanyl-lipoteichoic acid acyltransferase DltB (MBOAT superfamily)